MILKNIFQNPIETIFFLIVLILSITIHEFAHAWTANYLGDPTPKNQGRISINPLRHLDPFGSIFFLLVGFGWGKPVMTNPLYYKNPRTDYAITSLAGPMANLFMAIIFSLPYTILTILGYHTNNIPSLNFLELIYNANLYLFIFNLLPIYPLDGSKLVMIFIQNPQTYKKFIEWGPKILLLILLLNYWFPLFSWIFDLGIWLINYVLRGLPISIFSFLL